MTTKFKLDIALLILRLSAGGLMLVHGYPKLLKLLAGGNIQFADPIGIGMVASLILAIFSEFLCSLLIVIGFKTRLACIPLVITMFVAAFIVHMEDAWAVKEKAILFLVMYVVLFITGPGGISVDKN